MLWFVRNRSVLSSVASIGVRLLLRFAGFKGLQVDLAIASPDIEHFAVLFVDDLWRVNDVAGRSSAVGLAQSLSLDWETRDRARVVVGLQWQTEHGSLLFVAFLLADQALNALLFVATDSLADRLLTRSEWEEKKERWRLEFTIKVQ